MFNYYFKFNEPDNFYCSGCLNSLEYIDKMIQLNSYFNPNFNHKCFRSHSQNKVKDIDFRNIVSYNLKKEESMSIKPKTSMNMVSFNKFEVVLIDKEYICDISLCIDM